MKKRFLLLVMSLSIFTLLGGCSFLKKQDANNNSVQPTVTPSADGQASSDTSTTLPTKADYNFNDYIKLGKYKGVAVTVEKLEVKASDIDAAIQSDLQSKAKSVEITENRAVKNGDIVNIDYEGLLDGKAFDGGSDKDFDLTIGSGSFIPGFEDQLIGAKKGDKKQLNVTFPSDYQVTALAGKPVVFNVTVNSIKKSVVPELNEDYVKQNTTYKTVDEYKQSIKDKLLKQNDDTMNRDKTNAVMTAVVNDSTFTSVPQTLIDYYTVDYKNLYTQYATMYGMDFASFLSANGMSQSDFDTQAKSYAESMSKQELVIKAIIAAEKMTLSDQEYKDGVNKILKDYGYTSEADLLKNTTKEQLQENLLWQKAIDFVSSQAVVTETTPTPTPAATK
ncbi:MAG TPA: trigger factor [Mobilitalea sp.]|nr:trigger factor [Mobilitalea sp.]